MTGKYGPRTPRPIPPPVRRRAPFGADQGAAFLALLRGMDPARGEASAHE